MGASDKIVFPDLNDTSYKVSDAQRDELQKNGHIVLKNLIGADQLAPYRRAIIDATLRLSNVKSPWEAFLQYLNVWPHDEAVAKFVMAKRFAKIAADLMGVDNVRIYHDAALFKEAGGGRTPWHQDSYYFPVDTSNVITMWMPMVDISADMGMLTFASGSHEVDGESAEAEKLLKVKPDDFEKVYEKLVEEKAYPVSRASTLNAGDATWHLGWTVHSAPPNNSKSVREVMTVIYFADGAHVTELKNANQVDDVKWWLDSKKPGEKADGKLNPLVL